MAGDCGTNTIVNVDMYDVTSYATDTLLIVHYSYATDLLLALDKCSFLRVHFEFLLLRYAECSTLTLVLPY